MTRSIFCHEGNVTEFNAALRDHPDIRAFVAALHAAGLIDGLRGAWLRPAGDTTPDTPHGVAPTLSDAAETRILNAQWQRSQKGGQ